MIVEPANDAEMPLEKPSESFSDVDIRKPFGFRLPVAFVKLLPTVSPLKFPPESAPPTNEAPNISVTPFLVVVPLDEIVEFSPVWRTKPVVETLVGETQVSVRNENVMFCDVPGRAERPKPKRVSRMIFIILLQGICFLRDD